MKALSTQTMHSLRVRAQPLSGKVSYAPPSPWHFSQDLAWFLSLGGKFCASSWWKAVGGVVWGSFLATILRKCDVAIVERKALASAKPIVYASQTQKTSKKTAVSMHKKWRTSLLGNHVKLPLKGRSMSKYVLSVLFLKSWLSIRHQTNLLGPGCCWRLCLTQLRMPRDICKAHKPQLEALKQGGSLPIFISFQVAPFLPRCWNPKKHKTTKHSEWFCRFDT